MKEEWNENWKLKRLREIDAQLIELREEKKQIKRSIKLGA